MLSTAVCVLQARIPINGPTPVAFESDLFVGTAAVWVKGLPSAPQGLFKGKRRRSRISVQGRFKQPLSFDDVRPFPLALP